MPSRSFVALAVMFAIILSACNTFGPESSDTTATTPTDIGRSPAPVTEAPETSAADEAPQPEGMEGLSPALQAEITELAGMVEELRGLEFLEEPKVRVVTTTELAELVRADIEENSENVDTDEALNELLGLIEPGTSLLDTYLNLYGEQVAGFYDTDTRELVVPIRDEEFSALERSTIVHELTHAVTDQHFDLDTNYDKLYDEQKYDEAVAFQALIEGDAVATEFTYLQGLTPDEQTELFRDSLEADSSVLDAAPRFLQESLIFPYVSGREFVLSLLAEGGQTAVDEAYANPPTSSEQVITPSDFRVDNPSIVDFEIPEVAGYELIYDSTWGELSFELMFNQVLGGRPEAADGWGGDRYLTYFDGEDVVMLLDYVGDDPNDSAEMTEALIDYATEGMDVGEGEERDDALWFTGEDFAFVDRRDDRVLFLVASDPELGAVLAETLIQPTA